MGAPRAPRALAGPVALGLEGDALARVRDAMVAHIGHLARALLGSGATGVVQASGMPATATTVKADPALSALVADPAFDAARQPPEVACLEASAAGDEVAQTAMLAALLGDCPLLRRHARGLQPVLALAEALGRAWDSDLHPAADVHVHFIQPPLVVDTLKVIYTCGHGRGDGARLLALMATSGFAAAAGLA